MKMNIRNIELNLKEKKEFFGSFAYLYESGMSVGDIFKSIMKSTYNEKIKAVCNYISLKIDKGKTIEEAVMPCSKAIGTAYSALIGAGEQSGTLENILSSICAAITKQLEIRTKLITAIIYPVCMFFFALGVGMFFNFIIIPLLRSAANYEDVCTSSLFITGGVKIITIFTIIFAVMLFIIKTPGMLKSLEKTFSSIGIVRGILTDYYFTNFFYTMSLSYNAGVTASKSIMLANSVIGLDSISKKIEPAVTMTENGTPVSRALNLTGVFSGSAMSQIAAGEEAGKLDKMYEFVAKDYENQMNMAIETALKMLGPILLLIVGIFVGIIVVKAYSEYYNAIFSMF